MKARTPAQEQLAQQPTDLESTFENLWAVLKGPPLVREYRFDPDRRYRFDYAIPEIRASIELEGGTFTGGRHTRGKGYSRDACKYNSALLLGWAVFRLTSDMLAEDPVSHLEPIIQFIKRRFSNVARRS